MTDSVAQPILIAACGNTLAGDDAFGPLVARELARNAVILPAGVEVVDLGMRPAGLIDHLPGRRAVILVDAARVEDAADGPPGGTLLDVDFFAPGRPELCADRTTSTHALSLAGQLELARALGMLPPVVRLVALLIESAEIGMAGNIALGHVHEAVALIARRVRNL